MREKEEREDGEEDCYARERERELKGKGGLD